MENNDDFKPGKFEADMDQAFAAIENMAKMFGEFRRFLIVQGFSTEAAESISEVYAHHFFRMG